MIRIPMSPDMIHIGGLVITWHAFFAVVALYVAVWLVAYLARRSGMDDNMVWSTALWAIPAGIVGARIVHVEDYWSYYRANPGQIIAIWNGGIGIYGAFIGGVLGGWAYAMWRHFPVARLLDLSAPALALGQAIGRIGDLINGEHYSSVTSLPWGVVYTNPSSPGYYLNITCPPYEHQPCPPAVPTPMHPAVGYELLADMAIFGLLYWTLGRFKPQGTVFALFWLLYGAARFLLSFIRFDSYSAYLGINQQGWISLFVFVGALIALAIRRPSWVPRPVAPPAAARPVKSR